MKSLPLFTLLAAIGFTIYIVQGKEPSAPATHPSVQSFALMQQLQTNPSLDGRMDAAAALASRPDGAPWCVAILEDDSALREPLGLTDPTAAAINNAVLASLIQNLRPDVDPAVLWALTARLTDSSKGRFSKTEAKAPFGLASTVSEIETKPICDLAKEALIRALKVDHGFDKDAWRADIIARPPATTAPTTK